MPQLCADGIAYDKTYLGDMSIEVTGAPTFEFDSGNGFKVIDLTGISSYPNVLYSGPKGQFKFTLNGGTAFTKGLYEA